MKKNSKNVNSELEIRLLNKRNIVENVFSWMQNNRHLKLRSDRYQSNYLEYYYVGLIE